jgi:hypothetical protein
MNARKGRTGQSRRRVFLIGGAEGTTGASVELDIDFSLEDCRKKSVAPGTGKVISNRELAQREVVPSGVVSLDRQIRI